MSVQQKTTVLDKSMRGLVPRLMRIVPAGSIVLCLMLAGLTGCQTVSYYAQAVNGQFAIWRATEPIDEMLANEKTDPKLRQRLVLVTEIREFASRELHLPDNDSYRNYADLNRRYVIWNVVAAPEFSMDPVTWCFPIAGCVAYKGYFSRQGAERFAASLAKQQLDVYVGGVPAYSTLGWFDDPVLNTFINYPDVELARLIFHELAHQIAYAPDDTVFNESFATTVELEGVRRWLAHSGQSAQWETFNEVRRRQQDFVKLVMRTRGELEAIYQRKVADEQKRVMKVGAYTRMREEYVKLKAEWGGYAGYDLWFDESLNNAKLGSVSAYNQLVPAFQQLLASQAGSLTAFYAVVAELAKKTAKEREALLPGVMAGPSAPD